MEILVALIQANLNYNVLNLKSIVLWKQPVVQFKATMVGRVWKRLLFPALNPIFKPHSV